MDEEQPAKRPSALPVIVALIALPVIYVLSIGPSLVLVRHDLITKEAFRWFYSPLDWLGWFEPFRRFIAWYLRLW